MTLSNPEQLRVVDLFAGIGGFKEAFEQSGHSVILSTDWNDESCKTFNANSDNKMLLEDIRQLHDLPEHDILTAGFPCQPFSIAGKRKGFQDEKQGYAFSEVLRLLKESGSPIFLLENVKNLVSHDNGRTLRLVLGRLRDLGYYVTYRVMNSSTHSNIPQNRERIFLVGFKNEKYFKYFTFPERVELDTCFRSLLETDVDSSYYYTSSSSRSEYLFSTLKREVIRSDTLYNYRGHSVRAYRNVCYTLTANMGTGGHNVPIILDDKGIRKLTPRECANLQGFPKDYKLPCSNSSSYKQVGNSVTVPLIKRLVEHITLAVRS